MRTTRWATPDDDARFSAGFRRVRSTQVPSARRLPPVGFGRLAATGGLGMLTSFGPEPHEVTVPPDGLRAAGIYAQHDGALATREGLTTLVDERPDNAILVGGMALHLDAPITVQTFRTGLSFYGEAPATRDERTFGNRYVRGCAIPTSGCLPGPIVSGCSRTPTTS